MTDQPVTIRILTDARGWVRSHPEVFFQDGVPRGAVLMEYLVAGARALGVAHVEASRLGEWFIVAAWDDWFAQARFPLAGLEPLEGLTPFPELGQNCSRPECLVAAFAEAW